MQVTNYEKGWSFNYAKAEQVPQQCLIAAKILESQPLFSGSGSIVERCKVIPLDSWNDVRIFDIFNRNAATFTGMESAWHIHHFGRGGNQLEDVNGNPIKQGLELWIYDHLERCNLENLKNAYDNVYKAMCIGWKGSNPKDHQNIMVKRDSEEFALFVKNRNLLEEDTLIRFLTKKFGLEEKVICNSTWLKEDGMYYYGDVYMWINKEVLSEVFEKFGFNTKSSAI